MSVRELLEQEEQERLSPYAALAMQSRGRVLPDAPCEVRTCFQRDADRITHSKSFRRLMHKTQVFLQPEGDHYRTRMTHTLEVVRVARTIARALRLNEDLTEAIALGHDLGHTPFGHAGERALTQIRGEAFCHNEQSLRVVDSLERDYRGLNLTYEVRMGILGHTGPHIPETMEGKIVRLADKIAYINHDIDDAMRAGILTNRDIPPDIAMVLGETHKDRINTLVQDTILCSRNGPELKMTYTVEQAMYALREFMFERVYRNPVAKGEEGKAICIVQMLYDHYLKNPDQMPVEYMIVRERDGAERAVCDYIAGMTDKYAVYKFNEFFIPTAWQQRD